MGVLKRLACAAALLTLTVGVAAAQTTVKWLHIEVNPGQVKIWEEVARAFEAKNPGVKVEMQFLENEAYKAKLPTILQSRDRPHIIYSWAGGVLKAQIEAGVLEDITAAVADYKDNLAPGAVAAFTLDGKIYGLPHAVSQVGFMYNKELMAKANVDGAKIKTWDDLLAAVKALKAAGVTPIVVGGARQMAAALLLDPSGGAARRQGRLRGGAERRERRLRGRGVPEVRRAVQAAGRPAAVPERLPRLQEPAGARLFRRRQGGDEPRHLVALRHAALACRPSKQGISDENLGWFDFPMPPGAKGEPTDTLGGVNGWLITKGAPKEAVEFVKFFISKDVQTRLAQNNYLIPTFKGADSGIGSQYLRNVAQNIARSNYHQNFYDQALGPSVGRVVNDVTAEIAGGSMSPKDAAKAIQSAWKQGN